MTDDQLAAIISFGLPGLLAALFFAGYLLGVKRATRRVKLWLHDDRARRIERWTPAQPQQGGEPGTPERLLSDYEDAIYAEARHAVAAQHGDGDEQQHVSIASQLHADVRRLRGVVLAEIMSSDRVGTPDTDNSRTPTS